VDTDINAVMMDLFHVNNGGPLNTLDAAHLNTLASILQAGADEPLYPTSKPGPGQTLAPVIHQMDVNLVGFLNANGMHWV
jgi:hypothetical protein